MNDDYKLGKALYYSYCQDVLGKSSLSTDWEWDNWEEGLMTKEQWETLARSFQNKLEIGDL